jgi:hypothetical protein
VNKAEWANNMLQDQNFLDVFKDLQDIEVSKMINSNDDDYEVRQNAYVKFKALDSVMTHIQAMASQKQINANRWKIL